MVLVTLHYRLGPLGFLTTEDSAAPGNVGLHDQVGRLYTTTTLSKHNCQSPMYFRWQPSAGCKPTSDSLEVTQPWSPWWECLPEAPPSTTSSCLRRRTDSSSEQLHSQARLFAGGRTSPTRQRLQRRWLRPCLVQQALPQPCLTV